MHHMEDHFSNSQIHVSDLPSIETLNLHELHKEYLSVSLIGNGIFWLIFGGGAMTVWFFAKDNWPNWLSVSAPIVLLAIVLSSFLITFLGFKKKKYALRERDIFYQRGLLWRSKTVVPFNRIQHAEVSQGPIERMFNLSVLRIFTAGGTSSDMRIPGLNPDEANNIKEYILAKTAADEEE